MMTDLHPEDKMLQSWGQLIEEFPEDDIIRAHQTQQVMLDTLTASGVDVDDEGQVFALMAGAVAIVTFSSAIGSDGAAVAVLAGAAFNRLTELRSGGSPPST
jgi:hypothetical protein